jgi:hypothetical protein
VGITGISIWQLIIILVVVAVPAIIWNSSRSGKKKGGVSVTSVDQQNTNGNIDDDSEWYEEYTTEFECGDADKAVMAKVMAIHGGDVEKAKYEYVRLKVAEKKMSATLWSNDQEGGLELNQSDTFFNAWFGWLIAFLPCVIGAWIVTINQAGLNKGGAFLIGQLVGGTLTSAIPGLLIGGIYVLIKRPQVGATIILKKCIFWSALAMAVFVVIGIQSN